MALTRKIDEVEARVLGVLMEKERTTPDAYPLTVNALLAACNQRSNREPVTELSAEQVVSALDRLRRDVLVWRSSGVRVERWEHRLQSRWHLDPPAQAVMTLLLLRGAQTPGELRSRSERLHPFGDVAEVLDVLARLASGNDPLVIELPREPGQRETRWAHVMVSGSEAASATGSPAERGTIPADRPGPAAGDRERIAALETRIDELERRVERLEQAEREAS